MRGPSFFRAKAGRRDANHAAIRDGLRALGHEVIDCAGIGDGVADLLVYPYRRVLDVSPVWLELKVAKGRLRDSQLKWQHRMRERGIRVAVARNLAEALEALR
jgi:hypothetical protein